MIRMTKTAASLFLLLTLLGGIAHSVQHDVAAEFAHEIIHHATTHADDDTRDAHDDNLSHMHSAHDCLLGDISATPHCAAGTLTDYVVLPRPVHPTFAALSSQPRGLAQARAPPFAL